MDEKQHRRSLRREIGSYGWALLIYYLLINVCVVASVMMDMVVQSVQMFAEGNFTGMVEMDLDSVMGNGWGYILACALAVLFIRLWKGKTFFAGIWETRREMTFGAFLGLLSLFISGQLLFQVSATVTESLLNVFGLSVLESMEMATGMNDTFSLFLYSCLFAPVVEEIVFRGLVMRGLERHGRWFAIAASALFFGLFHGNIVQSPYAFAVGLVLGYVAMEYNIFWAMVMHMVNNLVLGDLIPRLTQGLGEMGSMLVLQGIIYLCGAAALILLLRKRGHLRAYRKVNPTGDGAWRGFITAPGVIVMIILMGINAFTMLIP